ncbi:hypothetical protein [Methylibium sp.]|uniref:hypothetical protein n=1 Tax=Methylibium sp. TaxID=2067992 RepID=UPI001837509F|nr:hypothetical protein [Methylibium sp.]MBA3589680.1 hypothetical protein [Methylibium sp.]
MEKRCFKCLCIKPLVEFYAQAKMADGHMNKCKNCTKADVIKHRRANLERVRAYDRLRGSMPHRVAARKAYSKTAEGLVAHARARRVSAIRFPERHQARIALGNAVRDGRIKPWPACAIADCEHKPEGHHPDYSRPLDVVWLCNEHHRAAHEVTAA